MKLIKYCLILLILAHSGSLFAHVGEHSNTKSVIYKIKGKQIEGHFLMERDGKVFIEQKNGKIISADLNNPRENLDGYLLINLFVHSDTKSVD
jgi:hypothetical protein